MFPLEEDRENGLAAIEQKEQAEEGVDRAGTAEHFCRFHSDIAKIRPYTPIHPIKKKSITLQPPKSVNPLWLKRKKKSGTNSRK